MSDDGSIDHFLVWKIGGKKYVCQLPGAVLKKLALSSASGPGPLAGPATPVLKPGSPAEIQKGRFCLWSGAFSTGVRGQSPPHAVTNEAFADRQLEINPS